MNFIVLVYLIVQISLCTSTPDRSSVRKELTIYKLSLNNFFDPYFNEEVSRRRVRRQATVDVFPTDDEDTAAYASGDSVDKEDVLSPVLTSAAPPSSAETPSSDWGWFRVTVNFLDSIEYSEDLKYHTSARFLALAQELTTPIEAQLRTLLDGYVEVIPLVFSNRSNAVSVVFDVGLCLRNGLNEVRRAVALLVADGVIGTSRQFRVSREPPKVLQLGTEQNRQECLAGPEFYQPVVSSNTRSLSLERSAALGFVEPEMSSQPLVAIRSSASQGSPCRFDQATCHNRQCIDRSYVCDGARDCSDGSDEPESCGNRKVCDPTEFHCIGTSICAQKIWRCDGDDDCGNGYDELNCPDLLPGSSCSSTQFQCLNSTVCIPSSHQCDGESDCDDSSDERGCSAPVVITPPLRQIFAVEGDIVTIRCEAAGTPIPVVSWRVNWGNVPPPPRVTMTSVNGLGTLIIREVQISDQGAYTCEVMNSVDVILATPDAVLIVEESPVTPPITITGCSLGYFNVAPPGSEAICQQCFCFGLTDQCHSSKYEFAEIGIDFAEPSKDNQGVKLDGNDTIEGRPNTQQPITENQIRIHPPARELQLIDLSKRFLAAAHYWSLPAQFLGAKINSYGGTLTFSYSYNTSVHTPSELTDDADIILEGNGKRLLYKNTDVLPRPTAKQKTIAILSEEDNWKTPEGKNATREDLMIVLEDLDKVLLRTTYDKAMISTGIGEVKMQVARQREGVLDETSAAPPVETTAYSVEECQCPEGYSGLSCETCDVGYERVRDSPLLGRCIFSDEQRGPPSRTVCNEGYTGVDCRQCAEGYTPYEGGCTRYPDTYCSVAGSIGVNADRSCRCKEGCEGSSCDRCKPGHYFLSAENPDGCLPCFCMNVSNECYSSTWNVSQIFPSFGFGQLFLLKNAQTGSLFEDGISVELPIPGSRSRPFVSAPLERFPEGIYYWVLPDEFTNNKLGSYGGNFSYTTSYSEGEGAVRVTNVSDVILTGNGITLQYENENHPIPDEDTRFHIKMSQENWRKESGEPVSREDMLIVLSNVESFLVRASYSDNMRATSIKSISLNVAVPEDTGESRALQVEQCVCPPGYTGLSCEECADGYYRVSSGENAGKCAPCNCNRHSDFCDKETGICLNCLHNTYGRQCDRCKDGYYGDPSTGASDACKLCPCPVVDGEGSIPLCSVDCEGRPVCKRCPVGYKGKTCQLCDDNYKQNPNNPGECELANLVDCRCDQIGSSSSSCDENGQCDCKASTTGKNCGQCQSGYFYLSEENPDGGCLPCFCMGITNRCDSAALKRNQITANFSDHFGGFRLTQQTCFTHITEGFDVFHNGRTLSYPNLGILPRGKSYFWYLPEEYRGDKIVSYGGRLEYKASYTTSGDGSDVTSDPDVILSGNGVTLTSRMSGPDSEVRPNEVMTRYIIFRENYWKNVDGQPATREQLLMALADVDLILIRATYDQFTRRTTISDFAMDTASDSQLMTEPAYEVEQCQCPAGYRGTSCQDCAPGFRRVDSGFYLGYCQRCQCNGHSEQCDSNTGNCLNCLGNTAGNRCENCAIGYYRSPSQDRSSSCVECTCPGRGENNFANSCYVDERSNTLQCSGCQQGYTGRRCELCADGYVGDPTLPGGRCRSGNRPQVCVTPNKAKVRIGGSAHLRCTVRSNSAVTIKWRRAGSNPGPLPSRSSVLEAGRLLRFNFFTVSDAGTYECVAINFFGSNSDSAVLTVAAANKPMIRVQVEAPSNVTVREGAQVSFVCTAHSKMPAYIVLWTKHNGRLPMSRSSDVEGTLSIRNVRISDTGRYVCTGSNMFSTDRAAAYLRVIPAIRPETPSAIVTPQRQQVSEGDEVMFYCTARGHPTPSIEWSRADGQPLPSDARIVGSMLMIPAASVDDGSVYSCTARNSFGEAEATGALDVTARGSPPVVTVLTPDVSVIVGNDVDLRCTAVGVPSPQLMWSKRNQAFPSNAVQSGDTLRLTSVTYANQGFYLCTARNQFGSDSGYVRVIVQRRPPSRPVCQTNPKQMIAYVGTNSSINCVVGGDPLPKVRWETENGSPLDDNIQVIGTRLFIHNVRLSNAGNYICVATNNQGESRSKMMLRVKKKDMPTVTISPRPYVRVLEGKYVYFTCLAPNQPDVIVTWARSNDQPFTGFTYFSNGGSTLNIRNISKAEEGNYICVAVNSAGRKSTRVGVSVVQRPIITVTPGHEIEASDGETIRMTCSAIGDPTPSVTWLKSNEAGQFTRLTNYRQRGITYTIEDVDSSDAGIYYCRAINMAGRSQKQVIVTVVESDESYTVPEVRIDPTTSRKFVGNAEQLSCNATGNPPPTVMWSKQHGRLPSGSDETEGVLRLSNLKEEDEGTYVCRAANAAGVVEATVYLQVEGRPVIRATPGDVTKLEGQSVTFSCVVVTNGDLFDIQLRWTRADGRPINFSKTIIQNGRMIIGNLNVADAGEYTCSASNGAGTSTTTVRLTVTEIEREPVIKRSAVELRSGEVLRLDCMLDDDLSVNAILWTKQNGTIRSGRRTGSEYVIDSIKTHDSGVYVCDAQYDSGLYTRAIITVYVHGILGVKCFSQGRNDAVRCSGIAPAVDNLAVANLRSYPLSCTAARWNDSVECLSQGHTLCSDTHPHACKSFVPFFTQTPISYFSTLVLNNQFYSTFNISISFRPNAKDGLLFYTFGSNRDFASLSLNNGYVEFRYELGSGTATIRSSNPVAMREWNSVIVSRSIFEGELRLNDDRVKKGRSPGEFRALNVDSNLYVGGLPSTLSLPTSLQYLGQDVGFYGCISQLDFGNGLVDFGSPDQTSETVGIVRCKTCGSAEEKGPCDNEGLCVETHTTKSGLVCKCGPGFSGEHCQIPSSSNHTSRLPERPVRAALRTSGHNVNADSAALQFHSSSYAFGENNFIFQRYHTLIEMIIRFKSFRDGILFFTGLSSPTSPFLSLSIRNNHIEFQFKNTAETHITRASVKSLEIGKWHAIVAKKRRESVELIVDGKLVSREPFRDSGGFLLEAPILIGAATEREDIAALTRVQSGFRGCLKELKIDDQPIDFETYRKRHIRSCNIQATAASEVHREPQFAASFSRGSYVTYPKKIFRHKTNTEQIRLRFKTTRPNGIILLQSQAAASTETSVAFILLEVKNSHLVYSFQIYGDTGIATSTLNVSNGVWHDVVITRRASLALMWLDNAAFPVLAQSFGTMPNLVDLRGRVSIGGVPLGVMSGLFFQGFEGCIGDVRLTAVSKDASVYEPLDDSETEKLNFSDRLLAKSYNILPCRGA